MSGEHYLPEIPLRGSKQRILITGAAGYIGSVLCPLLVSEGYHVTALDSFLYGGVSLAPLCSEPNFTLVRGDARSADAVYPLVAKADIVIPLAALVGAPACAADEMAAESVNFEAVALIVAALSRDQRIIYPNSNSGYGRSDVPCTEDMPLKPLSKYGRTKAAAEGLVMDHPNAAAFRLATVFGASPRHRLDLLLNDFVYRAVNDRCVGLFEPEARRNFVSVRDVARAFLRTIQNWHAMRGEVFNVGDDAANMTKLELYQKIARHVPDFDWFACKGHDPDQRDYLVSNAKILAAGWQPVVSIDAGIRELLQLYRGLRLREYRNA